MNKKTIELCMKQICLLKKILELEQTADQKAFDCCGGKSHMQSLLEEVEKCLLEKKSSNEISLKLATKSIDLRYYLIKERFKEHRSPDDHIIRNLMKGIVPEDQDELTRVAIHATFNLHMYLNV